MKHAAKVLLLMLAVLLSLQGTALALTPATLPPEPDLQACYRAYSLKLASEYLKKAEKDNQVLSPMSLYLALGMLAEGTAGQTLSDLQRMLAGAEGIPLGQDMARMWDSIYQDGDISRLIPANALWMNRDIPLKEAYIQALTRGHHAEAFSENFADPALPGRISSWISKKTEGLIQMDVRPSPADVMVLINTLYFADKWRIPFDKAWTEPGTFHLADGQDKPDVPYMQRVDSDAAYARGDGFLRADLALAGGGRVSFILPDAGTSPADLAGDPARLAEALFGGRTEQATLSWQVPRVDIENAIQMNDLLKALGLGSLFEGADLSGLSQVRAAVSQVRQANRILLDEVEVKAASVTVIDVAMAAPMDKPVVVDMHLTRPYLMAIYARNGELAFIAAVNNP